MRIKNLFLNTLEELFLIVGCFNWLESIFKEFSFADNNWFSHSARGYEYPMFLLQTELKNASRGFLLNDTLFVEAEIEIISIVKNFIEKK